MAIPKPITRVEQYLAHISGMRVNVPETPITREERYLAAWAKKSGIEDAEIQGDPPLTLKDCIGEPFKGLTLYGKSTQVTTTGAQLLKLVDREPVTICGLTWQIKNQCISVNGTTTDEGNVTDFYICGAKGVYADADFPEGQITISADFPNDIVMYVVKNGGTTLAYISSKVRNNHFEHTSGNKYRILFRAMKKGAIYNNAIKVMLNRGDAILPWEPYTGGKPSPSPDYPQEIKNAKGEVVVKGKNLFGGRFYYARYSSGIMYINKAQKDEEVKFPYQPAETAGICKALKCQKGKTYVISVTNPNKNAVLCMAEYENIENAFSTTNALGFVNIKNATKSSYTAKSDGILVCGIAGIWTDGKTTLHECTESELLQVEEASEATSYEPYREPQTLTITSPTSLPGIPVDSGGNYTDEQGQQWICDEVDLERGVYVQRVKSVQMDASNLIHYDANDATSTHWYLQFQTYDSLANDSGLGAVNFVMSSKACVVSQKDEETYDYPVVAPYGHKDGLELRFRAPKAMYSTWEDFFEDVSDSVAYYPLATPIETQLSETDLTTYRALTTYRGTTILESECGLKVKYSKLRK